MLTDGVGLDPACQPRERRVGEQQRRPVGHGARRRRRGRHRRDQQQPAPRHERTVDEDEPAGTRGSNEDPAAAQLIRNFGTGSGQNPAIRVLGALIEKGLTTPDYYPLTLNALRTACNQTTNRDPLVDYDDHTIEDAPTSGLLRSGLARKLRNRRRLVDWSS